MTWMKCHLGLAAMTLSWTASISIGLLAICAYSTTPGQAGTQEALWPSASELRLDNHRYTLLMFIHPRCPCSRASLSELARTIAIAGDDIDASVVVFEPDSQNADWSGGELRPVAEAIPNIRVVDDRDGHLAAQFGVATSGHVLVYQPGGELVFSGGLTVARGHEGESTGRRAILSLLQGQINSPQPYPVFGCPLVDQKSSDSQ